MHIHFIGICGVSMKSLAELSVKFGDVVSGSDISDSEIIRLRSAGIDAYVGCNIDKLDGVNLVVYTTAIKMDNLEIVEAKRLGIRCIDRTEYLDDIARKCTQSIYVCGSHGKSTTTSMICNSLLESRYGFIGHCGCDFLDSDSNLIYTGENLIVSEACEYNKNFLKLHPDYLVILNIDFDHPDTYSNIDELKEAYLTLARKTKKLVIVHESLKQFFNDNGVYVITFGENKSSNYFFNNVLEENDGTTFSIYKNGKYVNRMKGLLLGKTNCNNYLAVYIVLEILKTQTMLTFSSLESFKGIKRRYEKLGSYNGAEIVIDYAHHPTEIEVAIEIARLSKKNVIVVFEPHTYSRTNSMFYLFVNALSFADEIILLPTYAAREVCIIDDPSKLLAKTLSKNNAKFFSSYKEVIVELKNKINSKDVVLILGAGSVYTIGNELISMDKMVNI